MAIDTARPFAVKSGQFVYQLNKANPAKAGDAKLWV
jgi:hypothetical protein